MRGRPVDARYRLAAELVDDVEVLVRQAEAAVAAAVDPTEKDVLETQLDGIFALQDEVCGMVAPAIEQRERAVVAAALEALAALRGDPGVSWEHRHRRYHSPAVKARLSAAMGSRTYLKIFPA